MINEIEGWKTPQNILVILAHPDDPEFFLGGTIARWTRMGHRVRYILLTHGDKGGKDISLLPDEIAKIRVEEQINAANILGVKHVQFMNYSDGYLMPGLEVRRVVTRLIRKEQPDILVSCDPTNLFVNNHYINHPDHRAAGQIVVDALFPASGDPYYFPDLLSDGYATHAPKELWLSLTANPDTVIDVTDTWDQKIAALKEHKSQIGDPEVFEERMRSRFVENSSAENPRYEEHFKRFIFS